MENDREDQHDPDCPKYFGHRAKVTAICVELRGSFKDLKVAEDVSNDEQKQNEPGYGHHGLLAVRRCPKASGVSLTRPDHGGSHLDFAL